MMVNEYYLIIPIFVPLHMLSNDNEVRIKNYLKKSLDEYFELKIETWKNICEESFRYTWLFQFLPFADDLVAVLKENVEE